MPVDSGVSVRHTEQLRAIYGFGPNRLICSQIRPILPRSLHRPRASTEGSSTQKLNNNGVRFWTGLYVGQKSVIIETLLWRDEAFIKWCFSSGDERPQLADSGGTGAHRTLDAPSSEINYNRPRKGGPSRERRAEPLGNHDKPVNSVTLFTTTFVGDFPSNKITRTRLRTPFCGRGM